jgi:hypothetical protein
VLSCNTITTADIPTGGTPSDINLKPPPEEADCIASAIIDRWNDLPEASKAAIRALLGI